MAQPSVWESCQRGLVYPAPFASFATFQVNGNITLDKLSDLYLRCRAHIHANMHHTCSSVVIGVSLQLWQKLEPNFPYRFKFPQEDPCKSMVFDQKFSKGVFSDIQGDLWFNIKSNEDMHCVALLAFITSYLAPFTVGPVLSVDASSRPEYTNGNGRVLGCRFAENIGNPADPISLEKHIMIGQEDEHHHGGSFVIAQKFNINWEQFDFMNETQIEDCVGRKTDDTILANDDQFSHIKGSRIQNSFGDTTPILRLGLPFGKASGCPISRCGRVPQRSAEEGIYFAGFSKSVNILEDVIMNQIGPPASPVVNDRLLRMMKGQWGGMYFIPSLKNLQVESHECLTTPFFSSARFMNAAHKNWGFQGQDKSFPGVKWKRLGRHYNEASANGIMFYNDKNYLFQMSTGIGRENHDDPNDPTFLYPPTHRILSLMENMFSLWQDSWYFDRRQMEFTGDLFDYMARHGASRDDVVAARGASIMVRKGLAIKHSLIEFSSDNYGFRGRRLLQPDGELLPYSSQGVGKIVCGANTFYINPDDIIVGGMNNLSLGEGNYIMKYLSDEERQSAFICQSNLSEASGVGHIVPSYEELLTKGLGGFERDLRSRLTMSSGAARDLYLASLHAVQGICIYLKNFEELARSLIFRVDPITGIFLFDSTRRNNLEAIAERMHYLSSGNAPRTFTEAVQLLYTVHCSLHLNQEPTALGRLDQLLWPFYLKRHEKDAEPLEVIQSMYIKLGEKALLNRLNMQDHQNLGNLAFGGMSGAYPQGASLNQWIQQLTVGGTVADDSDPSGPGSPAYNELTELFLRASATMPLNAPCLSLRTREDIPDHLLKLAAKSILSGGAHPILLNDTKLVPGLHMSGERIGGPLQNAQGWDTAVALKSARNYACDGCYEPQFPGENWFNLGGFSTLDPLECALNEGKCYGTAGSTFLRGLTKSLTTPPADEINTFDDLLSLYYTHFDWLNRKALSMQLDLYGGNTAICPSPLLNILMKDCLERGRDFYDGGTKYNVFAPQYIALTAVVNSLWNIREMVFSPNAVTTLPELVKCLMCNWGSNMVEPFISSLGGNARASAVADDYKYLRTVALGMPRFGRGHPEVDVFGDDIIRNIMTRAIGAFTDPWAGTLARMETLRLRYSADGGSFGLQFQPGVGTFENCIAFGASSGASADGRMNGSSIATDASSMPSPLDLQCPIDHQEAGFTASMRGFDGAGVTMISDAAPSDYNIKEDFPVDSLARVLKQFAMGRASTLLTVTVANPETFTKAKGQTEAYNLLRVRTGGWTNFYAAVFPETQDQHRHRPISTDDTSSGDNEEGNKRAAAEAAEPRKAKRLKKK